MEETLIPLRGSKIGCLVVFLLAFALCASPILSDTLPEEAAALRRLASKWEDAPRNWRGSDPCGSGWIGITCSHSHITSIVLSGVGMKGTLSADIQQLVELVHLDLSFNRGLEGPVPKEIGILMKLKRLLLVGCSFNGNVPEELGNLQRLEFLSLNSNNLSGPIPHTLGNLSSLTWFDMTDNQLSGQIPISDGTNIGLDKLTSCQHFHFGKNNLSGAIPPELFHPEMSIVHFLFDHNKLTGKIPETITHMKSLQALRLDGNSLVGPVPSNINNLTNIIEMHLSNNQLIGPLPNLTGMFNIAYVDMSNNSFDESVVPPWFSSLPLLTTLILEHLKVAGQIPSSLFNFGPLQTARLGFNRFNGTLDMDITSSTSELTLVDLQNNDIQNLTLVGYSKDLILVGNPYCNWDRSESKFCKRTEQLVETTYSTPTLKECGFNICPSDQERDPFCICSYPYKGNIYFRFLTFSNLNDSTYYKKLELSLYEAINASHAPVVASIQNPKMNGDSYLQMDLWFFPAGKIRFNEEDIALVLNLFSNLTFSAPAGFGPYYFNGQPYPFTEPSSRWKRVPLIIGVVIGGLVLGSSLILLMIYACRKLIKSEKTKEISRFSGSWNLSGSASSIPHVKGTRLFSFDDLKKCTDNFAEANEIGSGGYGKVYRGTLYGGQLVAVKRAKKGSMQGDHEFKTEIELLSRVHHKNLVSLIGFCMDQNEQMLVYEYVPNGSLHESLSGKSGVQLDWKKRLWVALGAARGLAYLHYLADPPIIHRDIKSNNILLDHSLNAKVSDFGLSKSKPNGDVERKSYMTTQVKGTMGYMDPEYYMTQQLTEKSDVYGFGVVLLELVTARKPIDRGRYIVREVRSAMKKKKDLYGLDELLDPVIATGTTLTGFKDLIDLALRCVNEASDKRPTMSEVTKEIESILMSAGMNPNAGSATTSGSFGGASRSHPYDSNGTFDYSGGPYSSVVEPK